MKDLNLKLLLLMASLALTGCSGGSGGKEVTVGDDQDPPCGLTCNGGGDDGGGDDGGGDDDDLTLVDEIDFTAFGLINFDLLTVKETYAKSLLFSENNFSNLDNIADNIYNGMEKIQFNGNEFNLNMSALGAFQNLTSIEGDVFLSGLCDINNLTDITVLNIPNYGVKIKTSDDDTDGTPLTKEEVYCIGNFAQLEELTLFNADIAVGVDVGFLDSLTSLKKVDARNVNLTDITANTINKDGMTYIDLNGSTSEENLSLSALVPSATTLTFLDLKTVTTTNLESLSEFTSLEYIALTPSNEFELNGSGDLDTLYSSVFLNATSLSFLDLSGSGTLEAPSVFRDFTSLEDKSLNVLLLNDTFITIDAEDDVALSTLTEMQTLDLSTITIDSNAFLMQMTSLQRLYLNDVTYAAASDEQQIQDNGEQAFAFLLALSNLTEIEWMSTEAYIPMDLDSFLKNKQALTKVHVDFNYADLDYQGGKTIDDVKAYYQNLDWTEGSRGLTSLNLGGAVTNENIGKLNLHIFEYLNLGKSDLTDYSYLDGLFFKDKESGDPAEITLPTHGDALLIQAASASGKFCTAWADASINVVAPLSMDNYCI
jgi:hypothetical protein